MQIENISIRGIKGVNADWKPGRRSILCGANGAGKSGRLLAFPYALHGYTPLGKAMEATAQLSPGGDGLSVAVKLDDGFGWKRGISKDPVKKSLAVEISIDGREALAIAAADAVIKDHVGTFTAALNLSEFTGLSADRRRQFILGLCGDAGGVSDADLMPRLELSLLAEVLSSGQIWTFARATCGREPLDLDAIQRSTVVEKLWPTVDKRIYDAWTAMRPNVLKGIVSGDVIASVQAWTDTAKDLKSHHRSGKEGAIAAIKRLTEDKNALAVVSEHVDELRRRVADLSTQLGEVNQAIGSASQRASGAETARGLALSAERRLASARASLADAERELAEKDWDAEIDRLRRESDAMERKDLSAFEDALAFAQEDLDSAQADLQRINQNISGYLNSASFQKHTLEMLNQQLVSHQKNEWVHCADLAQQVTGGQPAELFAELMSVIRKHAINGQEMIILTKREIAKLQKAIEEATAGLQVNQSQALVRRARMEAASKDRDEALQALGSLRAMNGQFDACRKQIEILEAQRLSIQARRDQATNYVQRLEGEHQEAAAQAELATAGGPVDLSELGTNRDALRARIRETDEAIRAKERMAALEQELALCIGRSESEKVAYDLACNLAEAVKVIRETLLADLVRPLLGKIDGFLGAAGVPARSYCDLATERGKAIFDLGWIVEVDIGGASIERKISLDTLSGGESALYGSALAYALIVLSGAPLKVITVEADALDEQNLGRLIDAFSVVGDELDHVIIATCKSIRSLPGEWDLVRLEPSNVMEPALA